MNSLLREEDLKTQLERQHQVTVVVAALQIRLTDRHKLEADLLSIQQDEWITETAGLPMVDLVVCDWFIADTSSFL